MVPALQDDRSSLGIDLNLASPGVRISEVNVDDHPELAARFEVFSIPNTNRRVDASGIVIVSVCTSMGTGERLVPACRLWPRGASTPEVR